MGRTASTEPQCLYKSEFYLYVYYIFMYSKQTYKIEEKTL